MSKHFIRQQDFIGQLMQHQGPTAKSNQTNPIEKQANAALDGNRHGLPPLRKHNRGKLRHTTMSEGFLALLHDKHPPRHEIQLRTANLLFFTPHDRATKRFYAGS
jgi:hypothetical protein